MILAKNSDREPNEAQALVRYPHAKHKEKMLRATQVGRSQHRDGSDKIRFSYHSLLTNCKLSTIL